MLPLDNILKARRKYMGEDSHKIHIEQLHKSFVLVHKHLKHAKRRQAKYANKNAKDIHFGIMDPVFYKVHKRESKLHNKWLPLYRIIEQTSSVNFVIRNQLDRSIIPCHDNDIEKAQIGNWQNPKVNEGHSIRKAHNAVALESSASGDR